MDSPNPYGNSQGFVNLLNSQEDYPFSFSLPIDVGSPQVPRFSHAEEPTVVAADRKVTPRRQWTPAEDLVLISAWLNTSKDPIVGNDQKAGAFWSRIKATFNSSPKLKEYPDREGTHCKQRWSRMNDQVCKFVGCYGTAVKEQSSGQNDNDVMKAAHQIFLNDHGFKFQLEHAWRELRHDQKWTLATTIRDAERVKRRKCDEGAVHSPQTETGGEDTSARPPGVKAAKAAKGKKKSPSASDQEEARAYADMRSMWDIKQVDLDRKDKISKQNLLEKLLARPGPLSENEIVLKDNLIAALLS
ncbi:glutathione S-transferase T3-like [Eutrema salsugineum]|uniref:glutathione S-transferase T3-like n=1 Tax=Eutrema salsugineum TaxID=72664 RepID=UPI000CED6777|nr:glutathione S-transferase T3-like [Eutrema salsugineum]